MAHGFDELVNFLLDEVALRFAEGESITFPASRSPFRVIRNANVECLNELVNLVDLSFILAGTFRGFVRCFVGSSFDSRSGHFLSFALASQALIFEQVHLSMTSRTRSLDSMQIAMLRRLLMSRISMKLCLTSLTIRC